MNASLPAMPAALAGSTAARFSVIFQVWVRQDNTCNYVH